MSIPINKATKEILRFHEKLVGHGCYMTNQMMLQYALVENYVKKNLQLFSHFSSFDLLELQLLNDYLFIYF